MSGSTVKWVSYGQYSADYAVSYAPGVSATKLSANDWLVSGDTTESLWFEFYTRQTKSAGRTALDVNGCSPAWCGIGTANECPAACSTCCRATVGQSVCTERVTTHYGGSRRTQRN